MIEGADQFVEGAEFMMQELSTSHNFKMIKVEQLRHPDKEDLAGQLHLESELFKIFFVSKGRLLS